MVDFNEMNKRLADAGSKDARVNQLANELFKRGLAMTMDSAKQLAASMVETEMRVQKKFQERTHPVIDQGRPSYNEVARESVVKRNYNRADEPVRQSAPRAEIPLAQPHPSGESLGAGKTLRELHEEFERSSA